MVGLYQSLGEPALDPLFGQDMVPLISHIISFPEGLAQMV